MAIDEAYVKELLRVKGSYLYHRENQELEFKEQFNFAGLDDPVIEIAITPNRQDCLGVEGIARDLAAAGHGRFKGATPKTIKKSTFRSFCFV